MTAAGAGFAPAGTAGTRLSRAMVSLTAVLFVAITATLLGSHSAVKLALLGLFGLAALVQLCLAGRFVVYPRLIWFYLTVAVAGIVAAIVGLLNAGASPAAAVEGVRIYVAWSLLFIVLFTLLRSAASLGLVHAGLVAAGILISLINAVAIADQFLGWGLIPLGLREPMALIVGLNADGVIRLNSTNIVALFVIVPYLVALHVHARAGAANSRLTKVALVVTLLITALSGRRALWLVVALTPLTILLLAGVTGGMGSLRKVARRAMMAYCLAAAAFVVTAPLRTSSSDEASFVRHVRTAFSSADERAIQVGYLLEGFAESPVWGSGFGGYAGYLRSDERPWSYELTYAQLLFNVGLVGITVLGVLFAVYGVQVIRLLRHYPANSAIPFAIVVGIVSLLMGAYSDPYLGSFDHLLLVGFLPYLATFRSGFTT